MKARKSKNVGTWNKFKETRRSSQRALRKAEIDYINSILLQGFEKNNVRPFWRYIKAKKQDIMGIAPLKKGVYLNSDSFSESRNLERAIQVCVHKSGQLQTMSTEGSISYSPITNDSSGRHGEATAATHVNKSSGPDNISNRVLQELAPMLTSLLHNPLQQESSQKTGVTQTYP